jgi:hypothetical protein
MYDTEFSVIYNDNIDIENEEHELLERVITP